MIAAEPVEKKLRQSVGNGKLVGDTELLIAAGLERGIIDNADAELLRASEQARKDVIKVDDFTPDFS